MKYVEAMFIPNDPLGECLDSEARLGADALPLIIMMLEKATAKGDILDTEKLAEQIVEIANEEIQIDEHHVELDLDRDGSFDPLDGLGSIQHKMMLAGIVSHEIVAIVRLSDLTALIAEREVLTEA